MKAMKVRDLMVPLAEYATVSESSTLQEAILALEDAQKNVDKDREKHRAVLVYDESGHIVGKLSQWDVIKGLEPRYRQLGNIRESSRYGFSPEFIRSMVENYGLWRTPLEDICRKAAEMKVKDMMCTPSEGEYVGEDTSLDKAIHQLVMGQHQSLLVTRGSDIVGVLRLSDVFKEVGDRVKACQLR